MSERMGSNLAASVRQRLLNQAKAQGEEFQRTLTRYGMERLLYRLSRSEHSDRFILKGAFLFLIWTQALHRPTKDLDLLGYGDPSLLLLGETMRAICRTSVPEDGLTFLEDSVTVTEIREETEYGGLRVNMTALLGAARIPLQVDVGFGDTVVPAPQETDFPTLLGYPAPRLRAYPKETVIAEKFEALTSLGMDNSRLKDFFDLWTLAQRFTFMGETTASAIAATFARRGTLLPDIPPVALTETFYRDTGKLAQWNAFVRRSELSGTAPALADVIVTLPSFLMPPVDALRQGKVFTALWSPGGLWQNPS